MKKTQYLIVSAASAIRIASFCLSSNAGGDAVARAGLTANWLQHPGWQFHFDVWLPIHFWIMGAVALIVGNVELGGRLLSLILGIASVVAVWDLTAELDGLESAVFSSIVFALYSLHIAYSATSSCDVPYLFFVLVGLALFFRGRQSGSPFLWFTSALSLTVGSGIRYEAWIVIFALDLILVYRKQRSALAIFALVSGLWPAFWMIYEWRTRGNPMFAPALNHSWVAHDLAFYQTSMAYRLLLPPGVILISLTPLAIAGVVFSIPYIRKRKGLLEEFALVVGFFGLVQFYQIVSGGVMSYARYTLTLGSMAAVLSGVGLRQIFPHKKLTVGVLSLNLAALLILSNTDNRFVNKARSVSPVLRFANYLEDTGNYLREHMRQNDAVVIDNYNYEADELAVLAGMPLLENERAFKIPDSLNREKQKEKVSQLLPYLRDRRPVYLVYANQGELRSYLSFPSNCSSAWIDQFYVDCVFQNSRYQIYRIKYDRANDRMRPGK